MATRIVEVDLPRLTRTNRGQKTATLPMGATILGITPGRNCVLAVRADPQLGDGPPRTFLAVRAGVALTAEEEAGVYIGSWEGFWTDEGLERWYLFEVTA